MNGGNYQDLIVWQKSIELTLKIYEFSKNFPKEERYSLSDQMHRAAISIPSNIAEGHARHSDKSFHHFLSIAYGSTAELETQLFIANKLNYISNNDYNNISILLTEIRKMILSSLKKNNIIHCSPAT